MKFKQFIILFLSLIATFTVCASETKHKNVVIEGNKVTYTTSYKTNSISVNDKESIQDFKDAAGLKDGELITVFMVFMVKSENNFFEKIIKSLITISIIIFACFLWLFVIILFGLTLFITTMFKISMIYALSLSVFFSITLILGMKFWKNENEEKELCES